MTAPEILWTPTRKQHEFLAAGEDEVLYGGAAGGGKSDALVIDALGLWQGAPNVPLYRALLVRRTFPELRRLMDRAMELYPRVVPGAKFHESEKEWRFPSGAKVQFGYAEREPDRYQYQGQEFQYIGVDELTQWPTDVVYTYLISRLRAPERANLRCLVRATCNPGGAGHKWVRERWGINNQGDATMQHLALGERTWVRRFIPARLDDNPHLSETGYREQLLMLSEMERRALLDGRWDVIEIPGAIYRAEMERAWIEERIRPVPIDPNLPVHTAWDLGVLDATAIWFFQLSKGTGERRYVDYYEANGEPLSHYVGVLAARGYNYGTHFGPHDLEVRELATGKTRREVAAALGLKFSLVPNIGLEEGIDAARRAFPMCWFDERRCKAGIEALTHYRRDYNQRLGEFKPAPVHDWASHGCDAFRYSVLGTPSVGKLPKLPHTNLGIV